MTPTVSIVIATYNYGRYLAEALDSALCQTYQDTEFVVVDDGSTDNTAEVIEPYLANPKVRYHLADHVGQPAAKNLGIRLAAGKYIAFLDADDRWLPTKLEKQVACIERSSRTGVVATLQHGIDPSGNSVPSRNLQQHRGNVLDKLFWRNFVCFSSSLVRREVFDDVGLFDETLPLAIDYELWLRVAVKWHFDFVDEQLVEYRTGHANLSSRSTERIGFVRQIMQRFLDEKGGRALIEPATIKTTWAEHWCDTCLDHSLHGRKRLAALACVRSLREKISHGPAWRLLATVWWPDAFRRTVLKVLGKQDWRSPRGTRPDPISAIPGTSS